MLRFYQLAHGLWQARLPLAARIISHIGKLLTGIEIHPAAQIGQRLFIDHGSGVVIGETAIIGDDVTLYHGVTLGGTSLQGGKRHPTLGDRVIVGAGAKILGPIRVGDGARIGANAVVLADVPTGVTMVGIPARIVMARGKDDCFHAYGCDTDLPDPVVRTVEALRAEIAHLMQRITALESDQTETRPAPIAPPRRRVVRGVIEGVAEGDAP